MGKYKKFVLLVVAAGFLAAAPAQGAPVDYLKLNFFQGGTWYQATPQAFSLNVPQGLAIGNLQAGGRSYTVTASLVLTPAGLLTDSSSGGVASATFQNNQAGAISTLSIIGSIKDNLTNAIVFPNGSLLTAQANGNAGALESLTSIFAVTQNFAITGGELATGSATGITLWPNFRAAYDLRTSGTIDDFSGNIGYNAGTSGVAFEVPEPLSLACLGLGALLVRARRKS